MERTCDLTEDKPQAWSLSQRQVSVKNSSWLSSLHAALSTMQTCQWLQLTSSHGSSSRRVCTIPVLQVRKQAQGSKEASSRSHG